MVVIANYKKVVFENYLNFSGRARRSEYWYFVLANILLLIPFCMLMVFVSDLVDASGFFMMVFFLYGAAMVLPMLALICRRLHDINKSGWYYFVRLIPIIGPIWFLIMMCTEGDHGPNDYGNDPKLNYDEFEDIGIAENN